MGSRRGLSQLRIVEEGLFHGDDLPTYDPAGYELLHTYRREEPAAVDTPDDSRLLELYSLEEFLKKVFWKAAYHGRALVTGFNLPFDLSRLASDWMPASSRGSFAGGFSFVLWQYQDDKTGQALPDPNRPRLLIKHVNRNLAFIQLGPRPTQFGKKKLPIADFEWDEPRYAGQGRRQFTGHFVDLKTLAFALTDRAHSLASACQAFDVPRERRKRRAERHGVITHEYITYNRRDVGATQALLERVRGELERHDPPLPPWEIFSPASLAKSALGRMGITPPLERATRVSPVQLGRAASAYFGGRAEARIRGVVVPVVYTDVTSMYPTVNTLAQLWSLVTARTLRSRRVTSEARRALRQVTLEACLRPALWPQLRFFAEVVPERDVLPVRARYAAGSRAFTIGVNPLSAHERFWYSGFDLAASALLTGRVPTIRQAFTIAGNGTLKGLEPVTLRERVPIDPRTQDFFRTVIEERHRIKHAPASEVSPAERKRLDKLLKVIANSGSYGIFAQFDPKTLAPGKTAPVRVHGRGEAYLCRTEHPEDPGEFCFPPIAAWITSAARLMIAIIERLVSDAGGTYLFTDTDSMAIVASRRSGRVPCPGGPETGLRDQRALRALSWAAVDRIIGRLDALKPYGPTVRDRLLKLEDENWFEGKRVQLYGYMLSAKRYCLFMEGPRGEVFIRKPSEHGLGHLLSPDDPVDEELAEDDDEEPERDPNVGWIPDLWRRHVTNTLGRFTPRLPAWMNRPAVQRESFTTPASLKPFATDPAPAYADRLKPFNFMLRAQAALAGEAIGIEPGRSRIIAPFEKDPRKWLQLDWRDEYTKKPTRLTTGERLHPSMTQAKSMRDVVREYGEHPEPKSLAPDGWPCRGETVGLLARRHVAPSFVLHIGKEANRLEDVERGDVQEWEEVQETFERRGRREWELDTLPELRRLAGTALGAERLAAASGLHPRQIYRIIKRGKRPPPRTLRILTRVVDATRALEAPGT